MIERSRQYGFSRFPMHDSLAPTDRLLRWYDANRRVLPWRALPGETPDPYRIWLSEIMLQQTTVATVIGYYGNFLARWPSLCELAAADLDAVLHAWQGLGYYSRARNLHKCAILVAAEHDGRFPDQVAELSKLPGIGPYTAAAIAAIAFGQAVTPVDGNIERVICRLDAIPTQLSKAKADIRRRAEALSPPRRPGDFAQALMDLGATVCRPKSPLCGECPLAGDCRACGQGNPEAYPVRAAKKPRPNRYGTVYWIERPDGAVFLRRRPESGLLGGMMEFPSTAWRETAPSLAEAAAAAPLSADWRTIPKRVVHVFTHFRLELEILVGVASDEGAAGIWARPERFAEYALPTVMKKVAAAVQES